MATEYPDLEMWAAGFSFGSYIATTVGADDARVCALIAIAPPVHKYEFASVKMSKKPNYTQLQEPKELVEIDRANHLFDGQAGEVGDALANLLEDFSCRTQ